MLFNILCYCFMLIYLRRDWEILDKLKSQSLFNTYLLSKFYD